MRYTCRMINMMRLIVSWIDVSKFDEIRFALFANLEFWVSYTRFLRNIEISWNNNARFDQLLNQLLKSYEFVFICCIYMLYSWIVFMKLRELLWSRSLHSKILWLEESLWSWFSHRLSFFSISSQFALKIWKSSSWMTQKSII